MGQQPVIDQVERHHRQARRDKTIEPPLRRRCSSPHCRTGWEREENSPYCLACHQRINDRADEIRARARTKA